MVDWQQVCIVSWQAVDRRGGGKAKGDTGRETGPTGKKLTAREIKQKLTASRPQPSQISLHSFDSQSRYTGNNCFPLLICT